MKLYIPALWAIVLLVMGNMACTDSTEQFMYPAFSQSLAGRCYTTLEVSDTDVAYTTYGEEVTMDEFIGLPQGTREKTFDVDYDHTEIKELDNTWDINISSNSLIFRKSENSSGLFPNYNREIDSGCYERYYFVFDNAPNIEKIYLPEDVPGLSVITSLAPSPRLVVIFSEGFDTSIRHFRIDFD